MTGLDEPAAPRDVRRLGEMVSRRRWGEPLQYVIGSWAFRGVVLIVDRRVLIPRPETEEVVDVALMELGRLRAATGRAPLVVADLGTGSGAIALSMAKEASDIRMWATDRSSEALGVARANLAGLGGPATRVRLAQGSWFDALPSQLRGRLSLVVANPPYVSAFEMGELPEEVARYEPRQALLAGPTGLEALEEIVREAPPWLALPGSLVLEVAPHQADHLAERAHRAGFAAVEVRPDMAGRPRVLVGRLA